MGIRFSCPNGHALHVKEHLAGKRGICPSCGAKFVIPAATESTEVAAVPLAVGTATSPSAAEGTPSEKSSAIIPVIEAPAAPMAHAPAAPAEQSGPQANHLTPPMVVAPVVESPPSVVTDDQRPVSPAVKYIAQRQRARRIRTKIAILLLVAVLALAVVLVWTLIVGPAALGRNRVDPAFPKIPRLARADGAFSQLISAR